MTPRPDKARDMMGAPSWGSYRSRTMARAQTTDAARPRPCNARIATRAPMSGDNAAATLASV